LSYETDD